MNTDTRSTLIESRPARFAAGVLGVFVRRPCGGRGDFGNHRSITTFRRRKTSAPRSSPPIRSASRSNSIASMPETARSLSACSLMPASTVRVTPARMPLRRALVRGGRPSTAVQSLRQFFTLTYAGLSETSYAARSASSHCRRAARELDALATIQAQCLSPSVLRNSRFPMQAVQASLKTHRRDG